jgi:hypothetical protein
MGIEVFRSIPEALREGYQIYEHCPDEGHIKVRKKVDAHHWALALVVLVDRPFGQMYTPEHARTPDFPR